MLCEVGHRDEPRTDSFTLVSLGFGLILGLYRNSKYTTPTGLDAYGAVFFLIDRRD